MDRDELPVGRDGFAGLGTAAGLAVESVEVVDVGEWDDYETRYVAAVRSWSKANPDDPERAAFLERAAAMESSYREWRRGTFGYAIGWFRVPR
jgi:hypothetical protein